MKTLHILFVSVLIVIISACESTPQKDNKIQNENSRLNVLIIQPDQHRADVMGCAGNSMAITPNLDKLAAGGVHFTRAASASPVCCPFRATMQTGLYLHEHGVVENGIQLDYDFKTISEILADDGYATGYIGKWHLEGFLPKESVGGYVDEGPARQGWQEWHGYEKSHEFRNVWQFNDKKEKVPVEGYDWEPTWHTDMALDFIRRKTEEGKPWCYYLAYGPPHKPEQCLPEFLDMYDPDSFVLPPDAEANLSDADKKKLRRILQMYYAQVTAVDYEIGRLKKGLQKLGVDKTTIIIYTSDHGDVLGSNNAAIVDKYIQTNRNVKNTLRTKGKPFSTAFRIPLIIDSPEKKTSGIKTDALVSSVDIVPTILDLAGLDIPDYMQGISLADWIRKGDGPRQDYVYMGLHNDQSAWRAVWDGRFVFSELDYKLLYDLERDPYEINNLYSDPAYTEVQEKYMQVLRDAAQKTGDPILPRLAYSND